MSSERANSAMILRARIEGYLPHMSPDELRVLVTICERVHGARETYGPLSLANDRRNWRREAANELFDAMFYWCANELKGAK